MNNHYRTLHELGKFKIPKPLMSKEALELQYRIIKIYHPDNVSSLGLDQQKITPKHLLTVLQLPERTNFGGIYTDSAKKNLIGRIFNFVLKYYFNMQTKERCPETNKIIRPRYYRLHSPSHAFLGVGNLVRIRHTKIFNICYDDMDEQIEKIASSSFEKISEVVRSIDAEHFQ